jgi:hypothetical protein
MIFCGRTGTQDDAADVTNCEAAAAGVFNAIQVKGIFSAI